MKHILIAAASILAGCTTAEPPPLALLHTASSIELLALDPLPSNLRQPPPTETFHGFGVLGRASLSDPKARAQLAGLVQRGIDESAGAAALCFNPRHGLRVERGGAVLELVICYECLQMRVYAGPRAPAVEVLTAPSVEPEVTRVFQVAGLSIAGR